VGLIVNTTSPEASKHFSGEYHHHRFPTIDPNMGQVTYKFKKLKSPFEMPGEDYSLHIHKILSYGWYKINITKHHIEINVIGNNLEISMSQHMLVHPSLRYLSAQTGTLMLHSGAVSKNGKSLIFTGKGGMGKTTTTSLLLSTDVSWKIHADDYIFLNPSPLSFGYFTNSHLYHDLLRWIPELNHRLMLNERRKLWFFGNLRKYSGGGIRLPVRVEPERLWPQNKIEEKAHPCAILVLDREEIDKPYIKNVSDYQSIIDKLVDMNFGEARHFLKLIKRNRSVADFDQWLEDWKVKEREILEQVTLKVPIYYLVLPKSTNNRLDLAENLSKVLSLLID
jgi:hypothetical protein